MRYLITSITSGWRAKGEDSGDSGSNTGILMTLLVERLVLELVDDEDRIDVLFLLRRLTFKLIFRFGSKMNENRLYMQSFSAKRYTSDCNGPFVYISNKIYRVVILLIISRLRFFTQ